MTASDSQRQCRMTVSPARVAEDAVALQPEVAVVEEGQGNLRVAGFGRSDTSEIEAPNTLANLV
jgi:hypothetical protein